MLLWKRTLTAGAAIGALASGLTLHSYDYDVNSLAIVRLGRAGVAVTRIAFHYKRKLYSSTLDPSSQNYAELRSEVHTEAANMLLDLCCANKGVYVKVGQHIGALDYLVPREYVQVMRVLHSDAPASSFKEILKVLKEDLKRDPYEVFSEIDQKPLGAASLAQVHKAVMRKDGRVVAVKIQHPLVLRNSIVDMKTMEILVKVVSSIFEDFNFQWLVDETKINLPKELDFRQEAENAEKAKEKLQCFKWLKVPRVYWDLTTRRVLTMEFEEGGKINDLLYIDGTQIQKSEVTHRLGEMYAHMIFKHGFVHSDPHPGNILLQCHDKNFAVVLLDHGLYADLSDDFRLNYSKFWMSILERDLNGMKVHSTALGIGELYPLLVCMVTGRTWNSVTAGVNRIEFSAEEKDQFQREIPNFLTQIGEVLQKVNREMLLILKTNDLLRGIEHTLQTHKKQHSFITMTRCCIDNIFREKLNNCKTTIERAQTNLSRLFTIFKLNLYSAYLTLVFWAHLIKT